MPLADSLALLFPAGRRGIHARGAHTAPSAGTGADKGIQSNPAIIATKFLTLSKFAYTKFSGVPLVPTKTLDAIPNPASSYVGAKLAFVNDLVFNKLKAHLGVFSVSKYDGLVSPDYAVYYSTGVVDLKYLEYLFKTPQCIS